MMLFLLNIFSFAPNALLRYLHLLWCNISFPLSTLRIFPNSNTASLFYLTTLSPRSSIATFSIVRYNNTEIYSINCDICIKPPNACRWGESRELCKARWVSAFTVYFNRIVVFGAELENWKWKLSCFFLYVYLSKRNATLRVHLVVLI